MCRTAWRRRMDSNRGYRRLTFQSGLLTVYEVAREFEFVSLRQRVMSYRGPLLLCVKKAHLAGIRHPRSTGEPVSWGSNASFEDFFCSHFRRWT